MRPALFVFALGALFGCGDPAPEPPAIRPVRSEVIELSGAALRGTFSGVAEAGDQATLSFQTGGTIEQVLVKIGDRVKAGEPLARLDDTQLRLQLGQARASVAQASANRTLARQSLERTEALYLNDNASAAELEAARANADSATASLVSAQRTLAIAKDQLDAAVLEANRDGRVSDVLVNENENVGGGSPVIALTPDQRLQVTVAVPGAWVGRVTRGDTATATFTEVGGAQVPANVTEVGVTGQSGSFSVTVELTEDDERVRPGMGADVAIVVKESEDKRLELPLSAIGEDAQGRHVWIVEDGEDGEGVVRRRTVETGDLTSERVVVNDGLEAGTRVVIAGTSLMYDGRVVRVNP
ncbi:MAG: efflux RND transporter periplasmic adaptor subunit [Myxococcota bacterium]